MCFLVSKLCPEVYMSINEHNKNEIKYTINKTITKPFSMVVYRKSDKVEQV